MKFLDQTFEVIATGMEMIDAIVEAHQEMFGESESEPKDEHPATFGQSLYEDERREKR